jgi:hypothetical protein
VAQDEGPEFKSQYHKNKTKQTNKQAKILNLRDKLKCSSTSTLGGLSMMGWNSYHWFSSG